MSDKLIFEKIPTVSQSIANLNAIVDMKGIFLSSLSLQEVKRVCKEAAFNLATLNEENIKLRQTIKDLNQ